jgi:hypothetical protein
MKRQTLRAAISRARGACLAAVALGALTLATPSVAQSDARASGSFQFVATLIDSLSHTEKQREKLDNDRLAADEDASNACAADGVQFEAALRDDAERMRKLDAGAMFTQTQARLGGLYDQEARLAADYANACKRLSLGVQGNPDFGKISAGLTETARGFDSVERQIYQNTLGTMAALRSAESGVTPDVRSAPLQNSQKVELLRKLQTEFGDGLGLEDRGYLVDSAFVVEMYLTSNPNPVARGS